MVRQISLALAVAERLGIPEVLVRSLPEVPAGSDVLMNGVRLTRDPRLRPLEKGVHMEILAGDFFVKKRLPVIIEGVDFETIGESLRSLITREPTKSLPHDTLVVHVRSGDAFSHRPHGAMGQPPLAFYEKVMESEKPRKIHLVYENLANPVIPKIRNLAELRGIQCVASSGSFTEDLAILLSAKTLVTGGGTLADAIILLSPNIERWISFGINPRTFFEARTLDSVVSVFDTSGRYSNEILSGRWQNSSEQRELMLNFQACDLEISELRGLKE